MLKGFIGAIVAILVLGTIGTIVNNSESKKDSALQRELSLTQNTMSMEEAMEQSFMGECNSDGGLYLYCSCNYDYLKTNYGLEEMEKMGNTYNMTGRIDTRMYDAAQKCMYLIPTTN